MTILADVQENYIVWLLAGSRSQRWGYEEVLEVRQLLLRRGWGPNVCVWRLVGLGGEEAELHMMLVMVAAIRMMTLMTGVL